MTTTTLADHIRILAELPISVRSVRDLHKLTTMHDKFVTNAIAAIEQHLDDLHTETGRRHIAGVVRPSDAWQPARRAAYAVDKNRACLDTAEQQLVWAWATALTERAPDWVALARHPHGFRLDPATDSAEYLERIKDWEARTETTVIHNPHEAAKLTANTGQRLTPPTPN